LLAIAVLLVVILAGPWRNGQPSGLGAVQTTDTPGSVVDQPVAGQATQPLPSPMPAQTPAELFALCEQASVTGSWTEALAACERVRDQDPNYPGLARALATIYLRLAQEKLAQGATPAAQELLERALEYVEKGGVAQPPDAAAAQQRALAQAYQEGQAALASGDWPTAADKLQQVYDAAPDYGDGATGGGARQDLLAALLGWGEALLAAGDYGEAQRRCKQAVDLVPTSSEAAACQNAAVAALARPSPGPAAVVPPGSQQRSVFPPRYPERPKEPQALPSPQQAARY
jgi:tetratricopeptide (TPR) repeat protein